MEARSLIQFKDAPAIFNLTAEEEDNRYGCLKTYSEEAHKRIVEMCIFMSAEERKSYFRTPDFVWDGLDAAFIESKGVKPINVVKVSRVCGKRKLNESVSMLAEVTKESLDDMEDDSEDDLEEIPTKFRNEFSVAVLAYVVVLNFFAWPKFELKFGQDAHNLFVDRLFVAAVKLVLSIFDEEDFERICYRFEIRNEHTSLYSELFAKNDYHKAVAQLQWKFSHLWESDIYDALHQFVFCCQLTQLKPLSLDFPIRVMDESHISKALELMKKYIPLKGNIKAQLLLEHAHLKCFHVTDTLVLQAVQSVDLPSLFGDCNENEEKSKLLSDLGDAMLRGFNSLSLIKASEAVFLFSAVIFRSLLDTIQFPNI